MLIPSFVVETDGFNGPKEPRHTLNTLKTILQECFVFFPFSMGQNLDKNIHLKTVSLCKKMHIIPNIILKFSSDESVCAKIAW